jgi:hypothetical protein
VFPSALPAMAVTLPASRSRSRVTSAGRPGAVSRNRYSQVPQELGRLSGLPAAAAAMNVLAAPPAEPPRPQF